MGYFFTDLHNEITLKEHLVKIIISPDNGLWFLWVLFLVFICLYFIKKMEKYTGKFAYLIIILIVYLIPIKILGIRLLKYYLLYFLLGYSYNYISIKLKEIIFKISLIGFPILVLFWKRNKPPTFIKFINVKENGIISKAIEYGYMYMVAILGIMFVLYFVSKIKNNTIINVFSKLSYISMDIYILHFYFLIKFKNYPINIMITFTIALIISIIISYILRRYKFTSIYLLGEST